MLKRRLLLQKMLLLKRISWIRKSSNTCNHMGIRNLVNSLDEEVVPYLPDLGDVIQTHLSTDAANATNDEDDSEELPPIPAAEAQRLIQLLENLLVATGGHAGPLHDNPAAHEKQGQGYQDSPDSAAGHSELLYTSLGNSYVGNISLNCCDQQELFTKVYHFQYGDGLGAASF
jgi:hypothetical protein